MIKKSLEEYAIDSLEKTIVTNGNDEKQAKFNYA